MLMTKSGHASIRTLSRYSRPSVEALALARPARPHRAPTTPIDKTHHITGRRQPIQHPVPILVAGQLWWCRNAWLDAYAGKKASWKQVGDWHDRQRPNVAQRLRAASCRLDKHVGAADGPTPTVPMHGAIPGIIDAWTSPGRRDWPLPPTGKQLAQVRADFEARLRRRHPG
jgi:hypothetical protein